MKKFSTAVFYALACVFVLSLASCNSSDKQPVKQVINLSALPPLYGTGHDTSITVFHTPCDLVQRNYTKCDGTPGTYHTFLPGGEVGNSFNVKKEGRLLSKEELSAMFNNAGATTTNGDVDQSHEPIPVYSSNYDIAWSNAMAWGGWPYLLGLLFLIALAIAAVLLLGLLRRAWNWASAELAAINYARNNGNDNRRPDVPANTTNHTSTTTSVNTGADSVLTPAAGIQKRKISLTIEEDYTVPAPPAKTE